MSVRTICHLLIAIFLAPIEVGCSDNVTYNRAAQEEPDDLPEPEPEPDPTPAPTPEPPVPDDRDPPPTDEVPCALLSTRTLDFGMAAVGSRTVKTFSIENCSQGLAINVQRTSIVEGAEAGFGVEETEAGVLSPGDTIDIQVVFSPQSSGELNGLIDVQIEGHQALSIDLIGSGVSFDCVSVAGVREAGSETPFRELVEVIAGSTVEFNGQFEGNVQPEDIAETIWTVVERPDGAGPTFQPSMSAPAPAMFLDVPGVYSIELEGRLFNQQTCEPSVVAVHVFANTGIEVRLTWDTDGTDFDLHFLKQGRWNEAPYDCYWLNKSPNWGEIHSSHDDPELSIDDSDGFGPEVTRLNAPENSTYRLGVHAYRVEEPTTLRVVVRIRGEVVLEDEQEVGLSNEFWEVAAIDWGPEPQVRSINIVTTGFPEE